MPPCVWRAERVARRLPEQGGGILRVKASLGRATLVPDVDGAGDVTRALAVGRAVALRPAHRFDLVTEKVPPAFPAALRPEVHPWPTLGS